MKILTIVYSIGMGGTERAAVNFAIGYKNFGCDSKVLVLGQGNDRQNQLVSGKVVTIFADQLGLSFDSVCAELRDWHPDIIHIHNFHESLVSVIKAIKNINSKVVETNVFSRPCFSDNYRLVDLSMQLSRWGYCKYQSWMRAAKHRPQITISPNIINEKTFLTTRKELGSAFRLAHGIELDAFLIGRIGQPHSSKWDRSIIRVIRETLIKNDKIFYFFVGMPSNLKEEIKLLSTEHQARIRILDTIHGDVELSKFYHSIDCFAHISKIGESFGYVLAEAMLFNIPIVSMLTPLNDNAQYEMLGFGHYGICATSVDGFIKSILQLSTDKYVGQKLKENMASRVVSNFTEDILIPKQLLAYRRIIKNEIIIEENHAQLVRDQFKLWGYKRLHLFLIYKLIHHTLIYKSLFFLKTFFSSFPFFKTKPLATNL